MELYRPIKQAIIEVTLILQKAYKKDFKEINISFLKP